MSNLDTARQAIEAEIQHAKDGLAYYQARITSLEQTLVQLVGIGGVQSIQVGKLTTDAPASKAKAKPVKASKKPKSEKVTDGDKLPFTGGDFWINLINDTHKSASTVLKDAIHKLKIEPTTDQHKKLQGRMVFALNAMVKAGTIKDSGRGRDRVFFK